MLEWLRRKLGKAATAAGPSPAPAPVTAPLSAVPAPPPATPPAGEAPRVFDLGQGVRMHVAEAVVPLRTGSVACWTYRTEGFVRFGQKEYLYALKKTEPQPSADPVHQAGALVSLAAQGQLVSVGAMTAFGPTHPGLFGRPDIRGLGYAFPYFLEGAIPPGANLKDYLVALPMTEVEMQTAQACGLARVLVRMGAQLRMFPYPTWIEPTRGSAVERADLEASVLPKLGGYWPVENCAPFREQNMLTLRLSPDSAHQLATGLKAALEHNVGLLVPATAGWDDCVACLTWQRGAQGPMAITAGVANDTNSALDKPGEKLLGCFIVFATADGPQGVRMIEDGFSVMLHRPGWNALVDALDGSREFRLEAGEGTLGFVLGPK